MFGALNRFISRLDSDGPVSNSKDAHGASGFQVLRNKNADIPIEPWYDFIIGINGRQITNPDPYLFATEVRNCAGTNITLALWSAKGQRSRTLRFSVPTPSPTLGLTLQWTSLTITEDVWHILEVTPHSPADNAGLLPYGDYIVGTPEGSMHGEAGLGELVEDYLSRSLRLFVYNHEYGVTRLVTITPSRSWGGSGALGCVLGFGALHRLPAPLNEPPTDPGDTLFETARFSNEEGRPSSASSGLMRSYPSGTALYQNSPMPASDGFLVPATLTGAAPPLANPAVPKETGAETGTSGKGGAKAGRKPRKALSPGGGFDDMFREGEEKSREEDKPGSTRAGAVPPPPPPSVGKKVTMEEAPDEEHKEG